MEWNRRPSSRCGTAEGMKPNLPYSSDVLHGVSSRTFELISAIINMNKSCSDIQQTTIVSSQPQNTT
jgi:hypothetical protein